MVGIDTSDDAAVYKINEDTAIIETLDFFTPIVDDPYMFGQIAAANSLSDVYAMGGTPLFALNIVCFPTCLSMDILGEIIKGGADKVKEAGAIIVGGHSIDDKEPKYGLAVTGIVHPKKVWANIGANAGDTLILTKPLGTGIINTSIKGELATEKNIENAVKTMAYLNKYAFDIANKYSISACTDITGFGFLGHLNEMVSGSGASAVIHYDDIKMLSGAEDFAKMGIVPEGAYRNRKYLNGKIEFTAKIQEFKRDILFDPQTSGGLLLAVKKEDANELINELQNIETPASIVGEIIEKKAFSIYVD
ncbi:selenide, water dikinase [Oxobacter pfennigii]|uniref:Selenide, water dikinase n=1 Tax=Oxobacter pfennigii TaxID=36849 RepID=A0A0P9AFL0_9CLOT|nr:selenide, water dikinase [Oxobacter pfennigii]